MHWLRVRKWLLTLLMGGFLLDLGCPDSTTLQTAASGSIQKFANDIVASIVKAWANAFVGL